MSMKNVGDLMKRLQKMMPAHVEPAFKTGEELLAWQKEQGKLRSEALERENRAMKMQRTFNRSGIRPLHQNCSLDNYRVECLVGRILQRYGCPPCCGDYKAFR